ncbi:Peptidyl-prolyl cis-trans isomerase fpr2 [Marasmius sp. AFHP31]|nr:Peptidyl-prolyl cis-trans isomerase fpr2 [Marasmius sp. AFHP31]
MKLFSFVVSLILGVAVLAAEEPKELKIETTYMPEGCTVKAQKGDQIQVHYTGTLFADGKQFDSSLDRGRPFSLTLGAGQVIKGWDQGLIGMCEGEKRKLTIPADLGYGARGAGGVIPPNAGLVFTTELVKLTSKNRQEL